MVNVDCQLGDAFLNLPDNKLSDSPPLIWGGS